MASKKPGLGKPLSALLGNRSAITAETPAGGEQLRELDVDLIQRGRYQPRSTFDADALQELADSIRAQGVVQPVVVRPLNEGGRYELIAGERRWRAAQLAGLQQVPAVIRDVPDQAVIAMALIENIQREDLNPIEEATALQRLIDEFGVTHQEAAEAVGRSRAAVSNLLRLLGLNPDVRALLEQGRLEMGHGRALLALEGVTQSRTAHDVVKRGLSVRETEALVKKLGQPAKKKDRPALDPDIRRLQDDLAARLGAPVQFQHSASGKGKMVIAYNSLDELEGILAHLK